MTVKYGAVGSYAGYVSIGKMVVIDAVHKIPGSLSHGTILAEGYPNSRNGSASCVALNNNAVNAFYHTYINNGGVMRLAGSLPSGTFDLRIVGAYIAN